MSPHFNDFKAYEAHSNITDNSKASEDEKLAQLKDELGEPLFEELMELNSVDLTLYEAATARYSLSRTAPGGAHA